MAHSLKDRIQLRQLRNALNTKLFGEQNKMLAQKINMDPAWLHQSRLNFRYIFNHLDSFWPDWAIEQFSPYKDGTFDIQNNELNCLNRKTRESFSFFPKNNASHQMDVNIKGFISFPFLHWGLSLQCLDENGFHSIFQKDVSLNPHQPVIEYEQKTPEKLSTKMSLSLDSESDSAHLILTIKNGSDEQVNQSLHIGVVPFTNEGIGGIRSIQYCSNENDH